MDRTMTAARLLVRTIQVQSSTRENLYIKNPHINIEGLSYLIRTAQLKGIQFYCCHDDQQSSNNHLLNLFVILLKQAVLSNNYNGLSLISLTVDIFSKQRNWLSFKMRRSSYKRFLTKNLPAGWGGSALKWTCLSTRREPQETVRIVVRVWVNCCFLKYRT